MGVKAKVGRVRKVPQKPRQTPLLPVASLFSSDPPIETPTSQLAFLPRDAEAGSGAQRRLLFRELPEVKGEWSSSHELLVPCFIGGLGGTLCWVTK